MGDYTYRTRDEVEAWKTRCPILRLRGSIVEGELPSAAELEAIESEIDAIVDDALQFAERSPWPDPATATRFVFDESNASRALASATPRSPSPRQTSLARSAYMQATLEALAEEMARDPAIFVLGEGIGKRGGNFKTTAGLYDLYGPVRLCDTPICERGFVGLGCGAAMTGTRPVDRLHVRRFRPRFRRRDHQSDRQDPVHEQRPAQDADPAPRLHRHRPFGGHASLGQLLSRCTPISRACASSFRRRPMTPRGCLKQALRCNDPVIFLEHRELLGVKGPVPDERLRDRVWPGRGRPRGHATSRSSPWP